MSTRMPSAFTDLGISYRMLDYWVRQGYIRPAEANPGTGYERGWTHAEMQVVRRMAALVNVGFRPEAAAEIARRPGDLVELTSDISIRLRRAPAETTSVELPFTADPYVDAALDWLRGAA